MNNQGNEFGSRQGQPFVSCPLLSKLAMGSIQRRIHRVPEFSPSGKVAGPSDAYCIHLSYACLHSSIRIHIAVFR